MKIIVTGGAGFIGGNFIHMVNKYPSMTSSIWICSPTQAIWRP